MGTDCPRCGGTGFEYEDHEGQAFARPCACRRTPRDTDPLSICKIPPRYAHCTLANFDLDPQNRSQVAALQKALNFCAGFPHKGKAEEGLGLLFVGDTGVGKTHLAVALGREAVERGYTVLFNSAVGHLFFQLVSRRYKRADQQQPAGRRRFPEAPEGVGRPDPG